MKHVLITGATSGIGRELAIQYAKYGWYVTACGRNQAKLDALPEFNTTKLYFDITQPEDVKKASEQISQRIDLLILNAGTCEYMEDAKQFDATLFEHVIHTNLISTSYCLAAFLPHIPRRGQLALLGSSTRFFPFPRAEAYGASKAGIAYLAQSLRLDLKQYDIAMSLIEPGFVKTPLTDKNTFPMPMRISVQQVAHSIRDGLAKRKAHICPPVKFTIWLRIMSRLPSYLQDKLAQRMVRV